MYKLRYSHVWLRIFYSRKVIHTARLPESSIAAKDIRGPSFHWKVLMIYPISLMSLKWQRTLKHWRGIYPVIYFRKSLCPHKLPAHCSAERTLYCRLCVCDVFLIGDSCSFLLERIAELQPIRLQWAQVLNTYTYRETKLSWRHQLH